jgi:hypothetical protein
MAQNDADFGWRYLYNGRREAGRNLSAHFEENSIRPFYISLHDGTTLFLPLI